MKFSDYCERAKSEYFGYSSQASYMEALFKTLYITKPYSDTHSTSIYNGIKPFGTNVKKRLPHPVDAGRLYDFYLKHLKSESVPVIVDSFGIKASLERKKEYLASALAAQVKFFVESKEEDVECIIPETYENELIKNENKEYSFSSSFYAGDYYWIERGKEEHIVYTYAKFTHNWILHNKGTCDWIGRSLVLRDAKLHMTVSRTTIPIPNTPSKGVVEISVDVDVNQFEGREEASWDMVDSDGKNCFPGGKGNFTIKTNVTFDTRL